MKPQRRWFKTIRRKKAKSTAFGAKALANNKLIKTSVTLTMTTPSSRINKPLKTPYPPKLVGLMFCNLAITVVVEVAVVALKLLKYLQTCQAKKVVPPLLINRKGSNYTPTKTKKLWFRRWTSTATVEATSNSPNPSWTRCSRNSLLRTRTRRWNCFRSCPASKHAWPRYHSMTTNIPVLCANPPIKRLALKAWKMISRYRALLSLVQLLVNIFAMPKNYVPKFYPQIAMTISQRNVLAHFTAKKLSDSFKSLWKMKLKWLR